MDCSLKKLFVSDKLGTWKVYWNKRKEALLGLGLSNENVGRHTKENDTINWYGVPNEYNKVTKQDEKFGKY